MSNNIPNHDNETPGEAMSAAGQDTILTEHSLLKHSLGENPSLEHSLSSKKMSRAQLFLLDDYMRTVSIAKHQIDSFDHFVHFDIAEIVRCEPDIVVRYPGGDACIVKFFDAKVTRPCAAGDAVDKPEWKEKRAFPAKQKNQENPRPPFRDVLSDAGEPAERRTTPHEARMRDETYDGSLVCSVEVTCIDGGTRMVTHAETLLQQRIARLPIMVRSSLCNLRSAAEAVAAGECARDPGGYFIVRGRERVLVSQIRACDYNKILVGRCKDRSGTVLVCSARSISDVTSHSVVIRCRFVGSDVVAFGLVYTRERDPVPLGILLVALGFTDLRAAEARFLHGVPRGGGGDKYLAAVRRAAESAGVRTARDALEYIGALAVHPLLPENRAKYAEQIVKMEMLPHLGASATDADRAAYICKMATKLICARISAGRPSVRASPPGSAPSPPLVEVAREGVRGEDDRDDIRHKRVEAAGVLFSTLFRTVYKRYLKAIRQALARRPAGDGGSGGAAPPDVRAVIAATHTLTQNVRACFTTANWGAQNNSYFRVGVSQVLSRLNHVAMCSHLRRLATPVGRQGGKNKAVRIVHASQFFNVCSMETPEGSTTGIVLNFAVTTTLSVRISPVLVEELFRTYARTPVAAAPDAEALLPTATGLTRRVDDSVFSPFYANLERPGGALVMLNGRPIGSSAAPGALVRRFNDDKAAGRVHWSVTAVHDPHDCEVTVFCDEGRMMRPVLVCGARMAPFVDGRARTFADCLSSGAVRYVDANEINFAVVAIRVSEIEKMRADFCELSPNAMFGVVAGCAPYAGHTQAPRNIYFSNMARQAIGFPATTHLTRADTSSYVLHSAQKALVDTSFSRCLGFSGMPAGVNAVVAVASFTGYNQEDGLILNRASIQRGMFRIEIRRAVVCVESNPSPSTAQRICLPPRDARRDAADYSLLDEDGIIQSGVYVRRGVVLVGRVETCASRDRGVADSISDCSVVASSCDEGFVDRVFVTSSGSDFRIVKIVVRSTRDPEIGDKFCSRSAQKGTCGMILPQEDMPFDEDGVCPDIIINPNCMPSRMTINQLMEMVAGTARCFDGEEADATTFRAEGWEKNPGEEAFDAESTATPMDEICARLARTGRERHGWTRLYNGRTGRPFGARVFDVESRVSADEGAAPEYTANDKTRSSAAGDTKIFMGVAYYMRLKHLVDEKVHARPHGPKQLLTRQPLSGRKRDGGLRFGEMERDASIVIGMSSFLLDRLLKCSDPFSLRVCSDCGNLAVSAACRFCASANVCTVVVPFASRLLFSELTAMGIKINIKPKVHDDKKNSRFRLSRARDERTKPQLSLTDEADCNAADEMDIS